MHSHSSARAPRNHSRGGAADGSMWPEAVLAAEAASRERKIRSSTVATLSQTMLTEATLLHQTMLTEATLAHESMLTETTLLDETMLTESTLLHQTMLTEAHICCIVQHSASPQASDSSGTERHHTTPTMLTPASLFNIVC